MRHVLISLVALLVAALPAFPMAQSTQPAVVGTWNGPFDGDAAGTYSMTIAQDQSKKLGGTLQVQFEGGGYSAEFKSIVVDGSTATLKYDTQEGAEVQLDVTIDGATLKGSWKVSEPGTSTVSSSGTLSGTRK
jgi:hypothetical protein